MAENFDILIKKAQLRKKPHGELVDIAVKDGKIVAIDAKVTGSAPTEIDAKGRLVSESFVNTHLHLCKVYTLQIVSAK